MSLCSCHKLLLQSTGSNPDDTADGRNGVVHHRRPRQERRHRTGPALSRKGIERSIHNIENNYFRTKFEPELAGFHGGNGIGVISDTDPQPIFMASHLGTFGVVTVGKINNIEALVRRAFDRRRYFSDTTGGAINPTEVMANLICEQENFEDGIRSAQEAIQGSCSLLVLTETGIYEGRDRLGRTPLAIGRRNGALAVSSETCAFLWVYYGYPASEYEGINVEDTRNRCGAALAASDDVEIDNVAGIPDSGIGNAVGYATARQIPYRRPFVKYTPTWPSSFMPQSQEMRDLVARLKLIPIRKLIEGKRLLFCEDSIVRGTQLQDTIQVLYDCGAREVHLRPACRRKSCARTAGTNPAIFDPKSTCSSTIRIDIHNFQLSLLLAIS